MTFWSILTGAKPVARPGVQQQVDLRRVRGDIHRNLVAHQARTQVTVGRGGARKVALDRLVEAVVQAHAFAQ